MLPHPPGKFQPLLFSFLFLCKYPLPPFCSFMETIPLPVQHIKIYPFFNKGHWIVGSNNMHCGSGFLGRPGWLLRAHPLKQLHLMFILILSQKVSRRYNFPSKNGKSQFNDKEHLTSVGTDRPSSSHCECNFWPMFCSIVLRCTPFATTCMVHWGLRHHSFVVHWCVVAISRLMSTSFDDFHLVQNTIWNRRIPDRVTGYFVWARYSWK